MKKMVVQFEDGEVEYTITAKTDISYEGKTNEQICDGAEVTIHNFLAAAVELYNSSVSGSPDCNCASFDTYSGMN